MKDMNKLKYNKKNRKSRSMKNQKEILRKEHKKLHIGQQYMEGKKLRKAEKEKHKIYQKYIKRPMDFVCALFGLILLSPIMFCVAILIRVNLGSPIIFAQERPGLHEKIFKLYKFRSMSDERGADGKLLPDKNRLGKFGGLLRSTSLDELPELVNILKGDMSIVGPRPLLVKYLPRYDKRQHKRHDVRPGLTGYAQVHGRNLSSWEERFERDVWYVEHISFCGDMRIILQTIQMVLKRQGIRSETCVTMEEFIGKNCRK